MRNYDTSKVRFHSFEEQADDVGINVLFQSKLDARGLSEFFRNVANVVAHSDLNALSVIRNVTAASRLSVTANPAIVKFDDAPNAKNDLSIVMGSDSVRFLVNNKQVHAITRKEITDVSGNAGIRVNHNLDVIEVATGKVRQLTPHEDLQSREHERSLHVIDDVDLAGVETRRQ